MSDLLFPEVLYGLATTSFVLVSQRGYTRASTVIAALLAIVSIWVANDWGRFTGRLDS